MEIFRRSMGHHRNESACGSLSPLNGDGVDGLAPRANARGVQMRPCQELRGQPKSLQLEWSWLSSELSSSWRKDLIGPSQSEHHRQQRSAPSLHRAILQSSAESEKMRTPLIAPLIALVLTATAWAGVLCVSDGHVAVEPLGAPCCGLPSAPSFAEGISQLQSGGCGSCVDVSLQAGVFVGSAAPQVKDSLHRQAIAVACGDSGFDPLLLNSSLTLRSSTVLLPPPQPPLLALRC
jgi:hypothetical protein